MSWEWSIYTTQSPADLVAADAAFSEALAAFEEEHEIDDDYAMGSAGGPPPPRPEVVLAHWAQFGKTVPAPTLERLAACKATMTFEYVRASHDPAENPFQVTLLRFWLERLEPCVMDWGELSVELGEDVLARLRKMKSRGALGPAPVPKRKPVKRRAERPGEVRAVRILEWLEDARTDPELVVDARRALDKLSAPAQAYVELLALEGAHDDAKARRALGLDAVAFEAVAHEIDALLVVASRAS